MHRLIPLAVISVTSLLASCDDSRRATPAAQTAAPVADTVLQNGRIYTMNGSRAWADAIAIAGDRILYVGTNAGAAEFAGPATRQVDLDGRMVLPGLQDVHIHPIGGGVEAMACDLNGLQTLEQYRERIARCAESNPDASWITGGGWLMSVFGPGAMPRKQVLDELVPERPVFLSSSDGHTGWANSRALAIAGIGPDTPDPRDGRIDRDPDTGEAIGSLQEGAMYLVSRHVPEPSREARIDGLRYAVDMLHRYGITAIQDANVGEDDLQVYHELDKRGELQLRVRGALWWQRERGLEQVAELERLRDEYTRGLVRPTAVKIMQDGVMENFTAAMLEPYLQQGGTRGIPMIGPEALQAAVTALDARDFQVHFHAIGDAAIRQCLDAVEAARSDNGQRGNRHHISHLQLIDPADIPRFRKLQVSANFQPLWAYADDYITDLTLPFIGEQRARWMYPIRSVHAAGGMLAFGSDWSVTTANPFEQIEVAVLRQDPLDANDAPFIPAERIALPEALAAFTINAAWVNGLEQETGSLEAGKFADLVVLDRNLFEIDASEISDTRVVLTLFAGKAVHGEFAALQ